MPFKNEFYNNGAAGFVDFVWLWYNRLSVILFIVSIVILILATLYAGAKVRMVQREQFKLRGAAKRLRRVGKV